MAYYAQGGPIPLFHRADDGLRRPVRLKPMAHVDGDAVRPQYAIMANHRHDDGANAELLWDTDFGECGQPYLHLKRFVEPGEEITVDYGPRYAYEQHGFARAPAPNPRRLRRLGRNPFRDL